MMTTTPTKDRRSVPHARRVLTEAFVRNPKLAWTPVGLAEWWGIPVGTVNASLRDLLERRVIRKLPGSRDCYVLRTSP